MLEKELFSNSVGAQNYACCCKINLLHVPDNCKQDWLVHGGIAQVDEIFYCKICGIFFYYTATLVLWISIPNFHAKVIFFDLGSFCLGWVVISGYWSAPDGWNYYDHSSMLETQLYGYCLSLNFLIQEIVDRGPFILCGPILLRWIRKTWGHLCHSWWLVAIFVMYWLLRLTSLIIIIFWYCWLFIFFILIYIFLTDERFFFLSPDNHLMLLSVDGGGYNFQGYLCMLRF